MAPVLQKRDSSRISPVLKRKLQKKFIGEVRKLDDILHENGFLPEGRNLLEIWGYDGIQ